jgi:hypothetical protein
MPLAKLIRDTAHAVVEALGLEQKDAVVDGLATRWQRGTLVMQPADNQLIRSLLAVFKSVQNRQSEIANS